MNAILSLSGVALVLVGVALMVVARRYKNPGAPPVPSFNPKHWVQPWKISEWYQPKGAKLYHTSNMFLMAGLGLMIVSYAFPV